MIASNFGTDASHRADVRQMQGFHLQRGSLDDFTVSLSSLSCSRTFIAFSEHSLGARAAPCDSEQMSLIIPDGMRGDRVDQNGNTHPPKGEEGGLLWL